MGSRSALSLLVCYKSLNELLFKPWKVCRFRQAHKNTTGLVIQIKIKHEATIVWYINETKFTVSQQTKVLTNFLDGKLNVRHRTFLINENFGRKSKTSRFVRHNANSIKELAVTTSGLQSAIHTPPVLWHSTRQCLRDGVVVRLMACGIMTCKIKRQSKPMFS